MECKYCGNELSAAHANDGGHPKCLKKRNDRRAASECTKCGKPISGGMVYHDWCTVYSGYEP